MDLAALTLDLCLAGLDATHVSDDDGEHVDVLVRVDAWDEPLTIQLSEVELEGRGVGDELDLLQLYVGVPRTLDDDDTATVLMTLPQINRMLPLGAFSIIGEPPILYLRHIALVPRSDVGDTLVAEAVWLLHYGLDLFLPALLP